MNTIQSIHKNLPEKNTIWSLIDKKDFESVINLLLKADVDENDLGEVLFSLSDQAIGGNRFTTAINILEFIVQALEDKSEAPPLLKKIGDIYISLSEYEKAREYYGMLPLSLENIKLCFSTYLPRLDIDGLLSLRDTIITRIPETSHEQVHGFIDDAMIKIAAVPEIFNFHINLYKKNLSGLEKISPFLEDCKALQKNRPVQDPQTWNPRLLKVHDTIYSKQNNIWQKIYKKNDKGKFLNNKLSKGQNIMVVCQSPVSLFHFVDFSKTDNPDFIKFECRIIIDFRLLKSIMTVCDLSALNNCDFIIRFIDKNNLAGQLEHILIERKLPFTNRVVYLSQTDPDFFSNQVLPIIKRCETKIKGNIETYEKQLCELFPDDYKDKVLSKIETGQKLRILFFTSRFTTYLQYSTRDMAEGFRQLGHETLIEIEDKYSGVSIRKDVCLKNLINFQPDIIFSINHMRFSYPWVPKSIPFVTWIQDLMPHIMAISDPSLITDIDFIFSFSQHWVDNFFKAHTILKNKTIYCLPVTVSDNIYYPLPSCKKKYDVTFISHLPSPELTFQPIFKGNSVPEIRTNSHLSFFKQLINDLNCISLTQIYKIQEEESVRNDFVKQICYKLGIPFNKEFLSLTAPRNSDNTVSRFFHHIFLLMKIKPIMELIKNDISVRVFGKNWECYPEFQGIAMGTIHNGTELNTVINESHINLNLSPGTSYHMKVPEVIATNSFMLTRRIPKEHDTMPITNFFEEGKEVVLFDDEQDLINKAIFFLKNEKKRSVIANAAYQKFIDRYGIKKTAQYILNIYMKHSP